MEDCTTKQGVEDMGISQHRTVGTVFHLSPLPLLVQQFITAFWKRQ